MLGLPASTEFNRVIRKQTLYNNIKPSPALKRLFIDQVHTIYWRNKIAVTTANLQPGKEVEEVEVFEIQLKQAGLDETILKALDKSIPYHVLYILSYEGREQAWIGYKETGAAGTPKTSRYFHTDWMPAGTLPLSLEGLTLDDVYGNFIHQIAGDTLAKAETLRDSIQRTEQERKLKRKIELLEAKIRRERQFNVQVKLNEQLRELKKAMEELL